MQFINFMKNQTYVQILLSEVTKLNLLMRIRIKFCAIGCGLLTFRASVMHMASSAHITLGSTKQLHDTNFTNKFWLSIYCSYKQLTLSFSFHKKSSMRSVLLLHKALAAKSLLMLRLTVEKVCSNRFKRLYLSPPCSW